MSNILCIIPARGGSKGIPGKNIKDLDGQPLIAWSIKHAKSSKYISRVIVDTDSLMIQSIAKTYGADTPYLRPSELARDESSTESVLLYCLEWLRKNENYIPEYVVLLQPTSPIRFESTVDMAIEHLLQSNSDSLVGVNDFSKFLWKNHPVRALYNYVSRPRRQDIPSEDFTFVENGSIYITRTSELIKNRNRLSGKIALFNMSPFESFEIDSLSDWIIVENLLKSLPKVK
jgi:N-acylneuraminate cytidylyltransferase